MKLKLSKGYTATVDDNDPKKPWRFKWTAHVYCMPDGSVRNVYAYRNVRQRTIALHRFLLSVTNPRVHVDHKDRNGLNCRRKNIRKATPSQNQHNKGKQKNNTSGYKGVTWQQQEGQTGRWKAQIGVNGKHLYLGLFTSKAAAQRAYEEAAKKHHGRFSHVE